LLDAVQAPAGLLPAIGGVRIRFWRSGHGCSWGTWCGRDRKPGVCSVRWLFGLLFDCSSIGPVIESAMM
jgi:hypothetical protein